MDLERDTTIHDAESTESSADICFEAIKAEYDYCVTRAEKLENKKAEKEVASLEAKKAKAEAKAAEEAKKTEAEAVLKKMLASGMSADEILEKLR